MRKYNGIGANTLRNSRTSCENIYHSVNAWLQRGCGINFCFLKMGCLTLQDGEQSTAQDSLGCCAYSLFIGASNRKKAEGSERGTERVSWREESPELLLREKWQYYKSQAHEHVYYVHKY